ncbi:MlaD family protein [Nocardia sp. XZ_19_385]|uniref:MlaD family protein n=1 Tax=Nocardia sp. XZ_19_385 TaxID=2769488 RepID=UPI00188E10FB|nr:MlaD family protein [Nocardia sp. XZ_19_385]
MQRVKTAGHDHTARADRRELRWGAYAAAFVVAVLVAAAVLYLIPFGKSSYTADLAEARSVQAGDEIRIAGVTVGKVTGLELADDHVRMSFTIDSDIFLGDQTTLDVRMLTAVGGHYIAAHPAGSTPLGSKTIPADRVRLPYSLVRTLQDAAAPLGRVDGATLRENFAAVGESLTANPDALRRMGTALADFVEVLERQNNEVSQALEVSSEYLRNIADNKALLGTFIRQIGMLETLGLNKQAEIEEALRITGELLARIAALEPIWRNRLEPLVDALHRSLPQLKDIGARLLQAQNNFLDLKQRLTTAVGPEGITLDQSHLTLDTPRLCVPVPGRGC